MAENAKILLVGGGGVGTMAAYALETGGKADVTVVLRSNYNAVNENGFDIDSIQHGKGIKGFRPSAITKTVPDVSDGGTKFDYIVCATKNIADVKPTVTDILAPAVTPGHTAVLLLQNGFNIEKPLIERFPQNPILSGVSLIGATEYAHGKIRHDDPDRLMVGAYLNSGLPQGTSIQAAKRFVEVYSACGKVVCEYDDDVAYTRWRKLVYNSTYNSIATIIRMDTSRMRIYEHIIDGLVRPAMLEIKAIALAAGVKLPDDIAETMIRVDGRDIFFKPSMCQDIEKGNYIEYENIVGEPLREAERLGVAAPTLSVLYEILKALQTKVKEERGVVKPEFTESSRYG